METINLDCRHFRGDIPCAPHKEKGVHCKDCPYYDPIRERILIIKLDAVGDVLRTTSILEGLKEKYPQSRITWLTMEDSLELFKNNPLVDEVLCYSTESLFRIGLEGYDLVINLDVAPRSARLAEASKGKSKIGYGYSPSGYVYPFNKEAQRWYEMGVFDDIKKANTKTYQTIMLEICGLNPRSHDLILNLTDEEKGFARKFAEKNGITGGRFIIGLNTGAGSRWRHKKWTVEGYLELIGLLHREFSPHILLFGGPLEVDRNRFLAEKSPCGVIDTGCGNTLREFASLINLCNLVVTGDTLALHIAVALKKRVVVLLGPTSGAEIDFYGRGEKIVPSLECVCCYRQDCDITPTCMESIRSEDVMAAVRRLLKE